MTEETAITDQAAESTESEGTETSTETTSTQETQSEPKDATTTEETVGAETSSTETTIDPNSYTVPAEVPAELKQWAAKEGFTDAQFKSALTKYQEAMTAVTQGTMKQLAELGKKQLAEWGDEADTKLTAAKQALKQFDTTGEVQALLKQTGYGNHPAVLKFFAALGEQLGEGAFIDGKGAPRKDTRTLAEKMYPSMAKGD
jgi:hypothetical protein